VGPVSPKSGKPALVPKDRLDSWKEIATHLNRDVRTVQRWEHERGLPVYRVPGAKKGGVYGSRSELDAWLDQKRTEVALSRPDLQNTTSLLDGTFTERPSMFVSAVRALTSTPWQLYVAAVPCLFFAVITWWVHLCGPEQAGWTAVPSGNGFLVEAVGPGSAAARAGIVEGDRIVEWDGRPLFGFIRLRLIQAEIGRLYRLTVDRAGVRRQVVLTFHEKDWTFWRSRDGVRQLVFLLSATLYLVLGFTLGFARPRDSSALWGALCLGGIAIGIMHLSSFNGITGAFGAVRGLPAPLGEVFFGIASLAVGTLPALLITFLSVFPRRLFESRLVWAAIWVPNLARVGIMTYWLLFLTYTPGAFHGFGWTADAVDDAIFPQLLCVLAILTWNVASLGQGDAGRRVRIMMVGLAVTLVAALPATIFGVAGLPVVRRLTPVYEASAFPLVLSLFYPAFPISVVYAILRHRLFDIRLMVRQGLQYATARGLLLSLAPFMAALLAGDLWLHRNLPLAETLSQRRWLYAVLGIGGILLHWRRDVWLEALDRRFFREQYDARRLLHAVAEEARRVRALDQVASLVVSHIDAAMHPEFAAILVRLPGEAVFKATAAVRLVPAPIPAGSRLIGLVRVLEKPLEIPAGKSDWLKRQLPPEEAEFMRAARLEWVYPIVVGAENAEALLVLGPKRSEEPYSREDQTLLEAVAANLALLSLRPRLPGVLPLAGAAHSDRPYRG
jgi:hypothetical protein